MISLRMSFGGTVSIKAPILSPSALFDVADRSLVKRKICVLFSEIDSLHSRSLVFIVLIHFKCLPTR